MITLNIDSALPPTAVWQAVAQQSGAWALAQGVSLRDCVVLLPFVQLLDPARRAFAALGGWQPRVETTRTWAQALGPSQKLAAQDADRASWAAKPGSGSAAAEPTDGAAAPPPLLMDRALDTLSAAQLLRSQPTMAAWEASDPRAFRYGLGLLVQTAQDLARRAAQTAPIDRAAFWHAAGQGLEARADAGGLEAALARVALFWAQSAPAPETDALFDAMQAAAGALWSGAALQGLIWLDAGGADPLAQALAKGFANGKPATPQRCLRINLDPPGETALDGAAQHERLRYFTAAGLEAEAQGTVAEVILALNEGAASVVLPVLDRILARRVRALLERTGLALADETGWALSTTRAAASVMAALRAAAPKASRDERLAWLKCQAAGVLAAAGADLDALEAQWRGGRQPAAAPKLQACLDWEAHSLAGLRQPGRQPLRQWLQGLALALHHGGLWGALQADAAGAQILLSLQLLDVDKAAADLDNTPERGLAGRAPADGREVGPEAGTYAGTEAAADTEATRQAQWRRALAHESVDLAGFSAWVDGCLDPAQFVLPAPARAQVFMTPLARAMLRPFDAAVISGADAQHLLARGTYEGLLPQSLAEQLGMPTPASLQAQERLALAQLLRVPRVSVIYRHREGTEPVAASAAWQALNLARTRQGLAPWLPSPAPLALCQAHAAPVPRPLPQAPGHLPQSLSASAVGSLRACPYQFFAQSMLRLRETEELDKSLEARDHGDWLHGVLHRYHQQVADGGPAGLAALMDCARAQAKHAQVDVALHLPYWAGFEAFAPQYLAWQTAREKSGWHWTAGELERSRSFEEFDGILLKGRIDRIDRIDRSDRIDRHDPAAQSALDEQADTLGAISLGSRRALLDYKTGSATELKKQVRDPLEDTQLAFYALIAMEEGDTAWHEPKALYLALAGRDTAVEEIDHPGVHGSAQALRAGLAQELARVRAGAPLPALGEGYVCERCAVRGLCRRDHWADAMPPVIAEADEAADDTVELDAAGAAGLSNAAAQPTTPQPEDAA